MIVPRGARSTEVASRIGDRALIGLRMLLFIPIVVFQPSHLDAKRVIGWCGFAMTLLGLSGATGLVPLLPQPPLMLTFAGILLLGLSVGCARARDASWVFWSVLLGGTLGCSSALVAIALSSATPWALVVLAAWTVCSLAAADAARGHSSRQLLQPSAPAWGSGAEVTWWAICLAVCAAGFVVGAAETVRATTFDRFDPTGIARAGLLAGCSLMLGLTTWCGLRSGAARVWVTLASSGVPTFLASASYVEGASRALLVALALLFAIGVKKLYRISCYTAVESPEEHKLAPGPPKLPFFGHLVHFALRAPYQFLDGHVDHGHVVRFALGEDTVHVVTHPRDIHRVLAAKRHNYRKGTTYDGMRLLTGDGLLTAEGEAWRRKRRLLQPAFTKKAVLKYLDEIVEATESLAHAWSRLPAGTAIDLHQEMTHLAMKIIGRTTLGIDVDQGEAKSMSHALGYLLAEVGERTADPSYLPMWFPSPANLRFKRELAAIDRFVYRLIEERRSTDEPRDDLLQTLIEARDEVTGDRHTDEEVRDEVLTIFLAGHETTALALLWTWVSLARNAAVENRLHAEFDSVLAGKPPTQGSLSQLETTRSVVEESMRLYPPVWLFGRDTVVDDEIQGHPIPAGSMVVLCPLVTHRDPNLWDDPASFCPDRMSRSGEALEKGAYLPFGTGPRTCMGNHFAMMEMQAVLAVLGQRFRLEIDEDQNLAFASTTTLRPAAKIWARVHPRPNRGV